MEGLHRRATLAIIDTDCDDIAAARRICRGIMVNIARNHARCGVDAETGWQARGAVNQWAAQMIGKATGGGNIDIRRIKHRAIRQRPIGHDRVIGDIPAKGLRCHAALAITGCDGDAIGAAADRSRTRRARDQTS